MENCPDKYLHKKFKKQTNCELANKTQDGKENSFANREANFNKINKDLLNNRVNVKNDDPTESVPNLNEKSSISSPSSLSAESVGVNKNSASKEVIVNNRVPVRSSPPPPTSANDSISSASKPNKEPTESANSNFDTKLTFSHILPSVAEQSSANFFEQPKKVEYISSREEQPPPENKEITPIEKSSSGGGKYVCSYCNLACSKPSVLQKHIRAHTNERPYPCLSCGFSFKTRSNLYKHCRSRTHANRVMGNKTQEVNNETEECHSRTETEQKHLDNNVNFEVGKENSDLIEEENRSNENKMLQDIKSKPYKPRFHTKVFYENSNEESSKRNIQIKHSSNSDYLSLHINEVINKNNAIVNSNEPFLLRKRSMDNNTENENVYHQKTTSSYFPQNVSLGLTPEERNSEEPLNLSNKNRKRCVSEITEPAAHKSLIKELLLKNLYADSNMQCPYCKMIFQTVTELELHKLRSCKGFTKSEVEYNRSNSVNVASILTHNKNAFDSLSQFSTPFALKSPGPFLGKTSLVGSDKGKSFSFDDNLPATVHFSSFSSPNNILKNPNRYSLSSLTNFHDKDKKPSVKMFGGEVKITQKSGESRSFKIDNQDSEGFDLNTHFMDFKLRENRVVKSSLQSGGTVLQGKPSYRKDDLSRSSPDVIRVYENSAISPNIDVSNLEKNKINFDRGHHELLANEQSKGINIDLATRPSNTDVTGSSNFNITATNHSYKYTNIMDFSQKAAKRLAPNLKQPNLTVPGIPIPSRITDTSSPISDSKLNQQRSLEQTNSSEENNHSFHPLMIQNNSEKDQSFFAHQQRLSPPPPPPPEKIVTPPIPGQNLYNPVNLLVNGKVIRYVPGIPGPVVAEPTGLSRSSGVVNQSSSRAAPKNTLWSLKFKQEASPYNANRLSLPDKPPISPGVLNSSVKSQEYHSAEKRILDSNDKFPRSPKMEKLEVKATEVKVISEQKSPSKSSGGKSPNPLPKPPEARPSIITSVSSLEGQRKFSRPNTLPLKPSVSTLKQHHGLTPTMFNQILISPETPRVAKKYIQHFLNGNYFSYLGLKSSTKPTYCTLNKTQPFYVPHFKKLSMYSEWRQQESKTDELYVSAYDSRQRQRKYTTSGKTTANLIVHSSYKSESVKKEIDDQNKSSSSVMGGYESNEEYTYIRGRGRGRYVCDQCGIRCKKPSMLKKHIRTHTNDRPFTCSHCNFSFKTKGNLTKHMKSKSHTKNYAASSSSSSSTQQSGTPSSDTDTDDSGMDSSDESTRQQEHEAAYGLLSLSQNPQSLPSGTSIENFPQGLGKIGEAAVNVMALDRNISFMNTERVTHVNNTNYAKNKILDHQTIANFSSLKVNCTVAVPVIEDSRETENLTRFLGKTNTSRPLTYPYLSVTPTESLTKQNKIVDKSPTEKPHQFGIISKKSNSDSQKVQDAHSPSSAEFKKVAVTRNYDPNYLEEAKTPTDFSVTPKPVVESPVPLIKIVDNLQINDNIPSDLRKRKISVIESEFSPKIQRNDSDVMDLSCNYDKHLGNRLSLNCENGNVDQRPPLSYPRQAINLSKSQNYINHPAAEKCKLPFKASPKEVGELSVDSYSNETNTGPESPTRLPTYLTEDYTKVVQFQTKSSENFNTVDYDNSAMQTLADVATKQVKLEKNTIAKNVASAFLKLATKNELQTNEIKNFSGSNKDVNELISKSEENKSCSICLKNFNKPSQLRLHMNIHYLERPFRCDSCSVSFRTKGHLQKHERSASHHNKLSSSPTLSSSEPRPFKCSDCNIAFRIHGHLAKHLRSKMHIMKLECLAKIPFGLYAELERANSLLTEINTTDGDQCLESLKALAKKVFINDPKKLNHFQVSNPNADS